MRFKAEPGLFVRFANKYIQRVTSMKGIHFDANGEYCTENEVLIKLLSQHFEVMTPIYEQLKQEIIVEEKSLDEHAIREKGKLLKIKSWHIMNIDTLKAKIEEIEGV